MINILGAGAVGHLWYCRLRQAGIECQLISLRSQSARQIQLIEPDSEQSFDIEYQNTRSVCTAPFWLVCVKGYQLAQAIKSIADKINVRDKLILMMNGANLGPVAAENCSADIYRAILVHGAKFSGEKLIHSGGGVTWTGKEQETSEPDAEISHFIAQLDRALPKVQWQSDMRPLIWQKLVINAVINPLTALSGRPNAMILDHSQLSEQAQLLFDEIFPIAKPYLAGQTRESLQQQLIDVAQQTATNHSSMLQDRMNNRPMEIDTILMPLIDEAYRQKLPHSRLKSLYQKLIQLQ